MASAAARAMSTRFPEAMEPEASSTSVTLSGVSSRTVGRLEGDAGDVAAIAEGVLHHVAGDGEAVVVAGSVVVVGEGVHPLLRAHRVGLHRVKPFWAQVSAR